MKKSWEAKTMKKGDKINVVCKETGEVYHENVTFEQYKECAGPLFRTIGFIDARGCYDARPTAEFKAVRVQ